MTSFGVNTAPSNGVNQSFATIPLVNNRMALYTLSIRAPGNAKQAYVNYTFPLSPASLVKEVSSLTAFYDVAGSSTQLGVQRTVDSYGLTPAIFHIEGTTGWQYHATDGLTTTGIDSIIQLEQLLATYAGLNTTAASQNQPLYTLEFYDHFKNDYWQVEPFGKQEVKQAENRPLLAYYGFHFVGVVNLNAPPGSSNTTTLFGSDYNGKASTLGATVSGVASAQAASTPGAAAITAQAKSQFTKSGVTQ